MHTHANTMTPIMVRLLNSEAFVVHCHYHNKTPGSHLRITANICVLLFREMVCA